MEAPVVSFFQQSPLKTFLGLTEFLESPDNCLGL